RIGCSHMPSDSRETLQDGTSRRVWKTPTTNRTSADFIVRETAKSITLPNGISLALVSGPIQNMRFFDSMGKKLSHHCSWAFKLRAVDTAEIRPSARQTYDSINYCKEGLGAMYNSYFGFSVSPFSVTPDPNFFYTNSVYQEAYANLRYGIESKKGFIVITGEVGTGKTTLLRKLMHNLEGTIHTVFVFNTYLDFTELLRVILYDLGLGPEEPNRVTMLQELNDYLITQLKQGHIVTVLVDEAQNLSDEALEGLRLLSNLETDQEKLIQIVLMGQPELQTRLGRPSLRQLKQRVALQCRLVPLKDEEVGPYIDFRL